MHVGLKLISYIYIDPTTKRAKFWYIHLHSKMKKKFTYSYWGTEKLNIFRCVFDLFSITIKIIYYDNYKRVLPDSVRKILGPKITPSTPPPKKNWKISLGVNGLYRHGDPGVLHTLHINKLWIGINTYLDERFFKI